MKTPELEARWLRILETIAAPNKVSCFEAEHGWFTAKIEFSGGFAISCDDGSKSSAILSLLDKLSVSAFHQAGSYRVRELIATVWGVHHAKVHVIDMKHESQIIIGEKRFAGSTLHEAALYAFEASEFWRGVEKSAKFARYQANKLRG